jgi:CRP-like cAMP-binding protein
VANATVVRVDVDPLRTSDLFEGFSDQQLEDVAKILKRVTFAAGELIVREGEPADRWFLIVDGTATVTHVDLTGKPVTLAVLGPGESFGERALLDGRSRTATVSAITDLETMALDREESARQQTSVRDCSIV